MSDKIIQRILKQAQAPDLIRTLVERLSASDLQSLLLEVYRQRAARLSPADVLRQYERNRFVKPAQARAEALLAFDQLAFSLLPAGFEVLALSPVAPLGTNSAVATVDQNKILTTIRNTEVCADATGVLALEAALRRRALYRRDGRPTEATKLCASHRVLRTQQFDGPASFAHFALLHLCTAGRDRGSYRFEVDALVEQIGYYLRLFAASREARYTPGAARVRLTAFDETRLEVLRAGVLERLASEHPDVTLTFDQERADGRGYYVGAGFQIFCQDATGVEFFIVDGGFTDWTQQWLSNRKERLLTSGMGSERFVYCFS
jgi:hypothetical protein